MQEPNVNISAYKFVDLLEDKLVEYKHVLLGHAIELGVKGTILLSTEGINMFISAQRETIDQYLKLVETYNEFQGLPYKESVSVEQPFTRMLVRIKKEIISMGVDSVKPAHKTAPYISAEDFKRWYDEGKDMVVLDTRNDYEVQLGTFAGAQDLDIKTFRDFPTAVRQLPDALKSKPVVTFCTGGIRCEKAADYMNTIGFEEVYQLDGGILKYFEKNGGSHYEGECFVFDKRVSVNSSLAETSVIQCYACRMPLSTEKQNEAKTCFYCRGNYATGQRVANSHDAC
jgi:UPF0176 protein